MASRAHTRDMLSVLFLPARERPQVRWLRTGTSADGTITLRVTCATSWSSLMAVGVTTRAGSLGIRFEGGWGIGNHWIRSARPGTRVRFPQAVYSCYRRMLTDISLFLVPVLLLLALVSLEPGRRNLTWIRNASVYGVGCVGISFSPSSPTLLSEALTLTALSGLMSCAVPSHMEATLAGRCSN